MLYEKLFSTYDPQDQISLSEPSIALLEEQKKSWRQLSDGYAALSFVRTRELPCNGFSVRLQFNPRRIVSSGAKVDAKSISERKCFLCVENLPPDQKGILYRNEFLVLCNPAPIFAQHYTISNIKHLPQAIEKFSATLFSLAKDFSPEFTVFYNGPKCGASAPDHMHFQASPSEIIPVERDAEDAARRAAIKTVKGVSVLRLKNYGREVVLLEGKDSESLNALLLEFITAMRRVSSSLEEPMLNILCSYRDGMWRVIIFPRRKHRPDVYFLEGERKILISPASVDMGGLLITPVEKDFLSVDAALIENIFKEVSAEQSVVDGILEEL
ncbi:MAG: DUF4922 domain-containing protein [Bacteroidota bacterium]|nr:DUF4922 domain-containing protein [Bacteroidota bacterium]